MKGPALGFLAGAAAFVIFGGLHLEIASGRALEKAPGDARLQTDRSFALDAVNRPAKGDRASMTASAAEGRTITFQHPGLPSTTVAVRLSEAAGAAKSRPALNRKAPAAKPRQTVACEGVVSGLTEVAKQLDAGRCVT